MVSLVLFLNNYFLISFQFLLLSSYVYAFEQSKQSLFVPYEIITAKRDRSQTHYRTSYADLSVSVTVCSGDTAW